MYATITKSSFRDRMNILYPNSYSYEGLSALFDHYTNIEDETGETMEFDPVAIHCDWTEYDSLIELKEECPTLSDLEDLDGDELINALNEYTTIIPLENGGVLCLNF